MIIKLLKPGGMGQFADFNDTSFPLRIRARSRRSKENGKVTGYFVSQRELLKHGIQPNKSICGNDDFYFSLALGECEKAK